MKSGRKDLEKNRRVGLALFIGIVTVASLYGGLHLGAVYRGMEEPGLFGAFAGLWGHIVEHPFALFPTDGLMAGIFLAAGVMADLCLYNEYLRVSGAVRDAHGDAAFETDIKQYNLEFVYHPKKVMQLRGGKVTDRNAPYNEEHKRVLRKYPGRKAAAACLPGARILAEGLYMDMDGSWTQRNNNEACFGASGAGKFSVLFSRLYHKGKERMGREGLSNPELAVPVRFLIDECRNIGKIPNLGEYLATCRKYRISISVIFQNYSQIVEVYGKEEANSILGNCDTMIFLGGSDSDTLKIVCERLGKETVKTLSFGSSRGRMGSVSTNKQEVGRELMSRIQVEQMGSTECLVFVRALRPFRVKKFRLERHPNYGYLAEADRRYLQKNPFILAYDGEEMEAVRVKAVGEEGYIPPAVVDSARRRAHEAEKKRRAERSQEKGEPVVPGACDETKKRAEYERDLMERENLSGADETERLRGVALEELSIVDSFDPAYEFED